MSQSQRCRLEVSQPKTVYTSPAETRLLLSERERWIFNNRRVSLTLIIHWLGPASFLPRYFEAPLAIWSERLAKGPYQKNTPGSRLQIRAFYQLIYPGPGAVGLQNTG